MGSKSGFWYGLSSMCTVVLLFVMMGGYVHGADEPKIGIIYPETGAYSMLGPKHLDGLMMAIEDHGLLLGKKPKLIVRDDGTKVALAVSAAQELIKKEKVDVIIGEINTPICNAIATVCDEHKIPFLYPSGGSVYMSGLGQTVSYPEGKVEANPHPYMIYTWLNSVQRGYACLDVAELYGTRWYFVATDYEHGREAVGFAIQMLEKKYGTAFKNLGISWGKEGEVDYTSAINKASASKAEVVFVCLPGRFVQFQKQAAAMGLTQKAHIHWSYGERISATAAGDAAFGVTATVDYVETNPEWPLAQNFAERFHEKYKYWPGWPASSTYQGVRIFLQAIEKAGSRDAAKIMRALEGIEDTQPITGRPFFVRGCDHKSVQPLYTVQWTKSDKYEPGYWKILKKFETPEDALLPCSLSANYDKAKY